jgi:hypothetical protein
VQLGAAMAGAWIITRDDCGGWILQDLLSASLYAHPTRNVARDIKPAA